VPVLPQNDEELDSEYALTGRATLDRKTVKNIMYETLKFMAIRRYEVKSIEQKTLQQGG